MASTSAATTEQQSNLHVTDAAKSDDDAKTPAATSVATTNQRANLDVMEAAKSDDEAKAVAALTQSGMDVNCRENFGRRFTPLIRAIQEDSVKVARVLLADPRVDVNAADTLGQTALHRSWKELLTAIIDFQRKDINWNVVDEIGQTPLLDFTRIVNRAEIEKLSTIESVNSLARSIDGFMTLHEVAEQESPFPTWFEKRSEEMRCQVVNEVFKLLETRLQVLVKFMNATDILNLSALHYLAEEGSVEMLKLLLEKCRTGMTVTGVDSWFYTTSFGCSKGTHRRGRIASYCAEHGCKCCHYCKCVHSKWTQGMGTRSF
jgi:ankyrin repeat protein